jgi:hypothetical protein
MCRNITALRGLEPAATQEEIQAAALQYVRKVGGLSSISAATRPAVEAAVAEIAAITTRLLEDLPERKVPPKNLPPLRRLHGHGHSHDHDHEHPHTHSTVAP